VHLDLAVAEPLVQEVLPAWQGQGIGRQLLERMLARLATLYAIDLLCDAELAALLRQAGHASGYRHDGAQLRPAEWGVDESSCSTGRRSTTAPGNVSD
jgi:GNAT superfamily N-acetyltransferase